MPPGGEFNWHLEVFPGRDEDEYTILYHQYGLCALGRQEGLANLVPYMCAVDTMSVGWTGGRLYRTQTLASGGELCDFYICEKDSHWDRERSASVRQKSCDPDAPWRLRRIRRHRGKGAKRAVEKLYRKKENK